MKSFLHFLVAGVPVFLYLLQVALNWVCLFERMIQSHVQRLFSPARHTQGMNATQNLGREMTYLGIGGPALIVAGRSAQARLFDTWTQTLGEVGCR